MLTVSANEYMLLHMKTLKNAFLFGFYSKFILLFGFPDFLQDCLFQGLCSTDFMAPSSGINLIGWHGPPRMACSWAIELQAR